MSFLSFFSFFFLKLTQANVVCVVYDVTNEDTIDKVATLSRAAHHIYIMQLKY